MSDIELLKSYLEGDAKAFDQFMDRWESKIFTYVFLLLRDVNITTAVTQELFLHFFRNLNKLNEKMDIGELLFEQATFHSLRKLNHEMKKIDPAVDKKGLFEQDNLNVIIKSANPTIKADKIFDSSEQTQIITNAIQHLRPEYRAVFLLKEYIHLNIQIIAKITRLSQIQVESIISRCHLALLQINKSQLAFKPVK